MGGLKSLGIRSGCKGKAKRSVVWFREMRGREGEEVSEEVVVMRGWEEWMVWALIGVSVEEVEVEVEWEGEEEEEGEDREEESEQVEEGEVVK